MGCGGLVVIENWERVGGLEMENRYVGRCWRRGGKDERDVEEGMLVFS